MAEISPARVVYPDNRYKQIFSCYLFLILCFLGWSVEGSVEIVRGPVHKAVHGPGPWGGPWTGGQCFRVTRRRMFIGQLYPTNRSFSGLFDFIFNCVYLLTAAETPSVSKCKQVPIPLDHLARKHVYVGCQTEII